jgi:hypothetical protein
LNAEELAQVGGAGQRRDVARAQIEHPLRRRLCVVVAAKLDVGVGQHAVDHQVVRHFRVERRRQRVRLGEAMLAEQRPRPHLQRLQVVGRQRERRLDRVVGLQVERRVRRLSRALRERQRQFVVAVEVLGVAPDLLARDRHFPLGRGFGAERGRRGRRRLRRLSGERAPRHNHRRRENPANRRHVRGSRRAHHYSPGGQTPAQPGSLGST